MVYIRVVVVLEMHSELTKALDGAQANYKKLKETRALVTFYLWMIRARG